MRYIRVIVVGKVSLYMLYYVSGLESYTLYPICEDWGGRVAELDMVAVELLP